MLALKPFSYYWIVRRNLGSSKSVLDVGCGDGNAALYINPDKKYEITGIELYKPYIKIAQKKGIFVKIYFGDVRKMKFKPQSFDVVFSSQVIEHLTKKEALSVIKEMERIARKRIIIGTTNGFFPYDPIEGKDKNPLQVHKSGWEIEEMKSYGYKIYGQGLGIIYKPGGLYHRYPSFNVIWSSVSYICSPFTYLFPRISAYIIAIKIKC